MTQETAGEREALLPCPFCGCNLVPNTNQADMMVRRYGTHYDHPQSLCHLSEHEVRPIEVEDWNLRAAPPIAPGEREALIARVRKYAAEDDFIDRDGRPNTTNRATGIRELANLLEKSIAAKAQAPAEPAGWKLVPIDPTPEMVRAAQINTDLMAYAAANLSGAYDLLYELWSVLLAAAPKAPAENTSATAVDKTNASEQLRYFAEAARFDRSVFQDDTAFADWVQSRCRHLLAKLVEAGKAPAAPVARAHLDWIGCRLFERKWNGVMGPGSVMQWSLAGNYRHICANMRGDTFVEAIAAARCAEDEAIKDIDAGT